MADGFLNRRSTFSVTLCVGPKVEFLGTGERFVLSHILRQSANIYGIILHTNMFEEIISNEPYIKSSTQEEKCLRSVPRHGQKTEEKTVLQMKP